MHNPLGKLINSINSSLIRFQNSTTPNYTKLAQKTSNADHNISNFINTVSDENIVTSTEPYLPSGNNKLNTTTTLPLCPDDPPDLRK